jgi:hypothetical protein
MHQYGLFQVAGKTTTASGAVTAFYTRSSDDYNTQNWGVSAPEQLGTSLFGNRGVLLAVQTNRTHQPPFRAPPPRKPLLQTFDEIDFEVSLTCGGRASKGLCLWVDMRSRHALG